MPKLDSVAVAYLYGYGEVQNYGTQYAQALVWVVMSTTVPVLLIIFRRPDTTHRVFEVIREAEPSRLFIAADGPHAGDPEEQRKCEQTRAVVERIDWDCEVHRNYSDENLGCGRRPASAISWVFEHVDRAIILEDDCIPDPSFFPFCESVLERYEDVPEVMHVNGNTYGLDQSGWHDYSYGFGSYAQAWGWATWRRAWEQFDFEIADWPAFREAGMVKSLDGGKRVAKARTEKWNSVYGGRDPDVWDYQWHFAVMKEGGLTVVPRQNLVSNIGFSEEATHTFNEHSHKANIRRKEIDFPLVHPPFKVADNRINKVYRNNMLTPSLRARVEAKATRVFRKLSDMMQ